MTQALINGVLTGGLYAAFGIGLSLIYGVTRVISALHGALIILGAYLAYTAWTAWGVDPFLMVPVLVGVGFITGYVVQRVLINRIVRQNILMTITLTFGLELILVTAILLIWGGDLRTISLDYAAVGLDFAGTRIPVVRVVIFVLALALAVGLDLVVRRTEAGRRIRAVSQNREAAEILGLDVGHYYGVAHGLAAATAVGVGAFVPLVQPVQPFSSLPILLIAFAVVILGGFGTIVPVVAAGILLALTENFTGILAGPEYQRLSIFAAYLLVALARPHGLFGKKFYAH